MVVIIAIVSMIAAPRFTNSINLQRVESAARRLVVDLALAQRQATSANAAQTVRFDAASESYTLVGMPHPDHPGAVYRVQLGEAPYEADIVSFDFGGDGDVIFDIFGTPDSGGTVTIAVGSYTRTVTLDADTGRASIP